MNRRIRPSLPTCLFSSIFLASRAAADVNVTTPILRYGQTTLYANNTAFFLGGTLSDTSLSSDFFSLDLSAEFNSSSLPWISLPSLSSATTSAAGAVGADGRIYLLGGQTWDCSTNFLDVYDPSISSWGSPQFFGTKPIRRQGAKTFISNDDNLIFYFGGSSTSCSTGGTTVYNTMNALSLTNQSWFSPANSNPPVAETDFAVTKVSTGSSTDQVLIIGGQTATQNTYVQMSQVGLFDMNSQSWTFVTATTAAGQDAPEERVGHTAVTTSDGKVIVYGGTVGMNNRAAVPQLTVLDTSSIPFKWSNPSVSGNTSLEPSAGLTGHSAIMTDGDVMILTFGKDTNGNFNKETFFLDTQNMQWLSQYTPSQSPSPSSSTNSPSTSTKPKTGSNPTSEVDSSSSSPPDDTPQSAASGKTKLAVSTSVPISIVAIASAAVIIFLLRRRRNRNHHQRNSTAHQHLLNPQSYELNYLSPTNKYLPPRTPTRGHPSQRVFKRIFSRGKAHPSPPPMPPMGVFLPAWAQQHARIGGRDDLGVK